MDKRLQEPVIKVGSSRRKAHPGRRKSTDAKTEKKTPAPFVASKVRYQIVVQATNVVDPERAKENELQRTGRKSQRGFALIEKFGKAHRIMQHPS
jgi:hypothetical protein